MVVTYKEVLVIVAGLTVRTMMGLHPHSGQGKAPMFGDYEAQRHWQEVTVNVPLHLWYHEAPQYGNSLEYWGLDYPPLSAYHSWALGSLARMAGKHEWVESVSSRGTESSSHKAFMRATVLFADLLVLVPASLAFASAVSSTTGTDSKARIVALLLAYPGLILIDHGHFQYNGVSLGLAVGAVAAIFFGRDLTASILFVLALNYKQMELYHALPFFSLLLGKSLSLPWPSGLFKLVKVSFTVVATFAAVWAPFLLWGSDPTGQVLQVLRRIFPVARGLFEDKVANFWCAMDVAFKLRQRFSQDDSNVLLQMCTVSTLTLSLPSNLLLLLKPTKMNFIFSLLNTSTVFFLFSFQVHEKSILLVALPLVLYLSGLGTDHQDASPPSARQKDGRGSPLVFSRARNSALVGTWFSLITVFSMFPLLQKEGLALPTLSLSACFLILCHYFELLQPSASVSSGVSKARVGSTKRMPHVKPLSKQELLYGDGKDMREWGTPWDWIVWTVFNASLMGCLVLGIVSVTTEAPKHLPFLWPLLISVYCAGHFVLFGLYFHVLQVRYFLTCDLSSESEFQRQTRQTPPSIDSRKKLE